MNYIQNLIAAMTNDPDHVIWIIYCVAAIAGITLALAISYLFSGLYSPVKAQLHKLSHKADDQDLSNDFATSLEHTLNRLDRIPFINRSYSGDKEIKKLLIHTGFHSQDALRLFNAIKLLLLLSTAIISTILIQQFSDMPTLLSVYIILFSVFMAYLLPNIILRYAARRRMQNLRRFFPDALDLLIVCCESGLGLLESFQRVSQEMELAHPYLSHEMGLVCSKVRYGLSIQQALNEFSDRTGLEDIRGLNSVIVQSIKLGTGVAATIRVYANEYRDKRLQQAEENASKLGVKMVFPMMFCIWPSFFIVAVGPAVLKVMNVWEKAF